MSLNMNGLTVSRITHGITHVFNMNGWTVSRKKLTKGTISYIKICLNLKYFGLLNQLTKLHKCWRKRMEIENPMTISIEIRTVNLWNTPSLSFLSPGCLFTCEIVGGFSSTCVHCTYILTTVKQFQLFSPQEVRGGGMIRHNLIRISAIYIHPSSTLCTSMEINHIQ